MEKKIGYVAFDGNNAVKVGEEFSSDFLVFPSIEDSLRATSQEEKTIAKVLTLYPVEKLESTYYGYYNMIYTKGIKVIEVLPYEKVIEEMSSDSKSDFAKIRFLGSYKINPDDYEKFNKSYEVWRAVEFYQKENANIYNEEPKNLIKEFRTHGKVDKYGKYSN